MENMGPFLFALLLGAVVFSMVQGAAPLSKNDLDIVVTHRDDPPGCLQDRERRIIVERGGMAVDVCVPKVREIENWLGALTVSALCAFQFPALPGTSKLSDHPLGSIDVGKRHVPPKEACSSPSSTR